MTTCIHCGAELEEKDGTFVCTRQGCERVFDAEGALIAFGPPPPEPEPKAKRKK